MNPGASSKPAPQKSGRSRLDQWLVEQGHFASREKAQRAILAGAVLVNERRDVKSGMNLRGDETIRVLEKERYVGRGGLKMEGALAFSQIDPAGRVCLDVGASTGGFTDCLLQRGATKVFAVDVGHDQLDWKIRSDPRVNVREGFNVRYMTPEDIGETVSLCVIDVSFISLTKILPAVAGVLERNAPEPSHVLALIKPQFELGKDAVGTGGIVRDEAARLSAVDKIRTFVENDSGWEWRGSTPSPIQGMDGNQEFFAWLSTRTPSHKLD